MRTMSNLIAHTTSRFLTILLVALLTLVAATARANAQDGLLAADAVANYVTVQQSPRVDGDYITLGDVFTVTDERAAIRIAQAPEPGMRVSIPATTLVRFLRAQGLYWENAMNLRQVFVTRTSTEVGETEIHEALRLAFEAEGFTDPMDIQLYNRNMVIHLPSGTVPVLDVIALSYDPASGRFQADLQSPAAPDRGKTTLSGVTVAVTLVPVLAHSVGRGDILTAADFTTERMPAKRLGANIVTDLADVIGMETGRALRAGEPVRATDVKAPTLVAKGTLVTMIYEIPGMRLTNIGKALQSGGRGDTISLVNPRSHQTVMAEVIGPNTVSVRLGSDIKLAALN